MRSGAELLIGALAVGALILLLPRLLSWSRGISSFYQPSAQSERIRHSDLDLISVYHAEYATAHRPVTIDPRTWEDLDLDDVFVQLDCAASEPGRQYLYHLLRSPELDAHALSRLELAVRRFAAEPKVADEASAALSRLNDERAAHLAHLFYGDPPARPPLWWLFPILTIAAVVCLAFVAMWPRAAIVWVGLCGVNLIVQIAYKPRAKRFIPALHQLPRFLYAARSLGKLDISPCERQTRTLREGAKRLDGLRAATSWLMFEPGQTNELAASLYEYINLLFLLDVNAFVFAIGRIESLRGEAQAMFEAMGYIDATRSIARWRATLPVWTEPSFTPPAKSILVDGMVHPLINHAVANSLDARDTSVLVTGSNMSGKSTFIRALGVNAVLAQTLHTACAQHWVAPMLQVRSSIGRADSLLEGKSYYLAEVESVRALLCAKENGAQYLFLLDEIFRGTNTTERIAAGSAVLSYLDRGVDLVVVATHDLELLDLLGDRYAAYHFREQVSSDGLLFDYLIQPGASSTRNAIKLLELSGYPPVVIADAVAQVHQNTRAGEATTAEAPRGTPPVPLHEGP